VLAAADIPLTDGLTGAQAVELIAFMPCCACIARQREIASSLSNISTALAFGAGFTGIGLELVPFFAGYAAMTAAYGGVLGLYHSFACA
jgi:hypothetical protein